MIDLIAQSARRVIDMLTPLLVGMTAAFFVLWLASLCRRAAPLAKGTAWFRDLTPLRKLALLAAASLFTLWGGSKDGVLSPPSPPNGVPTSPPRLPCAVQLRTLPEEVSTNALAITGFGIELTNLTAYFETRWASNLFDYTDSSDFCLFASTNPLERRWVPLGVFTMPTDTNFCAFTVATNSLDTAAIPWFLDTFNGAGFYRFGIDFDSDGDGLTDACERYWTLTDPESADTDGDGMPDLWEYWNGLNPLADDSGYDPDGDGLTNISEYRLGTDTQRSDTDDDGLLDCQEAPGIVAGVAENWMDTSHGVSLLSMLPVSKWDKGTVTIPLPFPLSMLGKTCTNITVCVDGWVALVSPGEIPPSTAFNTSYNFETHSMSGAHLLVAGYWDDLKACEDTNSDIIFAEVHDGRNRLCVVEYRNVPLYARKESLLTFQVVFREDAPSRVSVRFLQADGIADGRTAGLAVQTEGGGTNLVYSYKTSGSVYSGLCLTYDVEPYTSPIASDTDGDGVADGDELLVYGTDPQSPDTDGDGIADGDELLVYGTDPQNLDTDGDGISDSDEILFCGTDPSVFDDPVSDTDGDGIPDLIELYMLGSDPGNQQSPLRTPTPLLFLFPSEGEVLP
ncbi:MAG: hypothetical protein IKR48_13245 [Kiritimatiellae bacterium]|nr:hypothetical protein [Kiritimatiellia bacterium]